MTNQPTASEFENHYSAYEAICKQMDEIREERKKYKYLSSEHNALSNRLDELIELRIEMIGETLDRLSNKASVYRRPEYTSTRLLPPLPKHMTRIHIDQETTRTLDTLPGYRLPAFLLLAGVMGLVVGFVAMVPSLILSPVLFVIGLLSLFLPGMVDAVGSAGVSVHPILLILVSVGAVLVVVRRGSIEDHFLRAALQEEQWFRSGSENWTTGQKIISCIVFGWVHIYNLIYPIATLISLCFAGGVMMYVYQREFNRSQDIRRATLAATKLHARYNTYALRLLAIVMLALVYVPIL